MARSTPPPQCDYLLDLLDEAFHRKSWHGTNLRGSIRGLSAKQAAWSPGPGRKCIWAHVLHTAYYKYVVRRRILGEKRGSFPLAGSNWIPLPAEKSDAQWKSSIAILEGEHRRLREAIAGMTPAALTGRPGKSKLSHAFVIRGAALHDIYHTGQIQFIKRMMR